MKALVHVKQSDEDQTYTRHRKTHGALKCGWSVIGLKNKPPTSRVTAERLLQAHPVQAEIRAMHFDLSNRKWKSRERNRFPVTAEFVPPG
ncbi:hypothetical protein D623_10011757 [Myotis brandtii]|uniref:Uncharacterized protein n=1 Tax=Myotis brandtii TaxID=109478 RepID=S7N0Z8_MYOBR|nr:hypothetical protein D623_10011757 [Myotis brandtii]